MKHNLGTIILGSIVGKAIDRKMNSDVIYEEHVACIECNFGNLGNLGFRQLQIRVKSRFSASQNLGNFGNLGKIINFGKFGNLRNCENHGNFGH